MTRSKKQVARSVAVLSLFAVVAFGEDFDINQPGFWYQYPIINEYYCGTSIAVETPDPRTLLHKTKCAREPEVSEHHVSFYCRLDPAEARRLIDRMRNAGKLLGLRPGCENVPALREIYFIRDKLTADRETLNCELTPSICGLVDDRLITVDYYIRLHEAAAPLAIMVFLREKGYEDSPRYRGPTRLSPPVHSGPWARASSNPCEQVPRVKLRFAESAKQGVLTKLNELGEDARTPCMGKPAFIVGDEKALKNFVVGRDGFREWQKVTLTADEGRLDDAERYRRLSNELAAHDEQLKNRTPHARALAAEEVVRLEPYAERVDKIRKGLIVEPVFEK